MYLGQALFVEKPSARVVARDFFSCLPQLVLLQGLLRVILILPVITWIIPYTMWPYLSEVILLERNPLVGSAMRVIGIGPTLTLGALLRFGIVAALTFIASRAVRPVVRWFAASAIVVIALWWCAVVFANAVAAAHL